MHHSVNIRSATHGDLEAISLILNQAIAEERTAYSEPVPAQHLIPWLEEHLGDGLPVVVAELDDLVIGWASLSAYRKGRKALRITAEVSFYVHRLYHGAGVGSTLIRHMEDVALSLGIKNLFGIILDDNAPSVAVMKKHGYIQWAHMPDIAEFGEGTKGHIYMGKSL